MKQESLFSTICRNGFSVDHVEPPELHQIRQAELTVQVCMGRYNNCHIDCPIRGLIFPRHEKTSRE